MTGIAVGMRGVTAQLGRTYIVTVGVDSPFYGFQRDPSSAQYGAISNRVYKGIPIDTIAADSVLAPLDNGFIFQLAGSVGPTFFTSISLQKGDGNFLTYTNTDYDFFASSGGRTFWVFNQPSVLWDATDLGEARRVILI